MRRVGQPGPPNHGGSQGDYVDGFARRSSEGAAQAATGRESVLKLERIDRIADDLRIILSNTRASAAKVAAGACGRKAA